MREKIIFNNITIFENGKPLHFECDGINEDELFSNVSEQFYGVGGE